MSRFKNTSKFKNALVNVHKNDSWIHDLNVGSNLSQSGDHIKASCDCLAFISNSNCVGSVSVLPIDACGRFSSFPLISGHSGAVTDFSFSPFHDRLLATGSEDNFVKLWEIPEGNVLQNDFHLTSPTSTLGPFVAAIENLQFHPSADEVLAISSKTSVLVYDLLKQQSCYDVSGHDSKVESMAWHSNGQFLSTMSKSGNKKLLQVFDPRAAPTASLRVEYHNGQKCSSVLFLGDTDYLVTSGLSMMREAEIAMWDIKKLTTPLAQQNLGSTSGNPSVLYDADSKLLFVAVKSDSSISYYDASMSLLPSQQVYRGSNQTKGVTMVPKRAMNVMSCEIVRLLQLTQNAIIPISYHVQRKSSDFHADLFPNTFGGTSAMTAEQWLQGANLQVELVSLDPMKKPAAASPSNLSESSCSSIKISEVDRRPANVELETNTSTNAVVVTTKNLNIVRSSKFRHIEGHFRERSSFINKFPSLSSTVPGDSNAFQINRKRVAAVLKGAGGQIGIFELSKTGRLDRSSVPTLQNTSTVLDFAFDPFDFCRIIVACEDAKLRLWTIPCEGLCDTLTDPKHLIGHQEKPNVVQFHPQAKSLMASAGYDRHLLVWDISKPSVAISLDDLSAPLFCMAWSPDGVQLATFAKDCVLSIFEPRSGSAPIKQGTVSMGSRGARLVWLGDTVIAISGFNRTSVRTVTLYDTSNLDVSISGIAANVSPAILVPYFDFDTKLLFLTGKGDSVVLAYEYVKDTAPYLFAVSSFNCGSPHQAVAFLPKVLCDVSKVEIATGLRLTSTTVEGFSICVPRTRTSYFQDDLYPDTLCVEDSPLTAQEWLSGENAVLALSSMKPLNLKPLSEAPKEPAAARKFASYNPHFKTDKEKKDELLSAMIDRMGDKEEEPLPQQDMDGAESDEWTE